MNNSTLLERQMRQWKLRQPSPKIRKKLFQAAAVDETGFYSQLNETWRWLLPVMGCFLLVLLTLTPQHPQFGYLKRATNTAALSPLAQPDAQLPSLASVNYFTEHNTLPKRTVEWTFGAVVPAKVSSWLQLDTNRLWK